MYFQRKNRIGIILCGIFVFSILIVSRAWGNELDEVIGHLGSKKIKEIKQAIQDIARMDQPQVLPTLFALKDRHLRVDEQGQLFILSDDETTLINAITKEKVSAEDRQLRIPRINNSVRRLLSPVIAQLQLQSDDPSIRLEAAKELSRKGKLTEDAVLAIRVGIHKEQNRKIKNILHLALARIDLASGDMDQRIRAIERIGEAGNLQFKSVLEKILIQNEDASYPEPEERIRQAAKKAIAAINLKQTIVTQAGNLFYGLSLGSVLLLTALGLAITFGLMGVINMAHGEMLMLGAYSTYVIQNIFNTYLPNYFDWYPLFAIPVAFFVTAIVGIILERTVIRHLYTRPLETLLATWGVSLIIIQTVRLIFGAQNVEVANPNWLSGGIEVMPGLVLTYNRIAIIIFAVLVVFLVWYILQRTRLGLQVRAVTQNRSMAASMGISTAKIDMWAFGLGSGVAGLGGVALSQLTNVGPELGQLYIIDSFMVVVLGGVGKIIGTVVGALGLGIANKFLEPVSGAVLGKIFILIFIILFIQKFPQGIFSLKGRDVEN
ncbi:urea ABC transporter permease subunit UrtB [PVC group bacterium]|nr:urea ABC transporter permease subunit UrtB [PVC group bacterium]